MPFITTETLILVADAGRAMLLANEGTALAPRLVQRALLTAPEPALASDRPGRMPDPGPGHRSALEQTDAGRVAAEALAAEVAEALAKALRAGKGRRLVLVAPPQMLGALRDRLAPPVRAAVAAELSKTLTNHPLPKIAALVEEALG
ncbi:MAG TPA: host attachment protein [Paracoccaceae bacterium]|nr:host attachment protein [Paracoccaceae bacterium]